MTEVLGSCSLPPEGWFGADTQRTLPEQPQRRDRPLPPCPIQVPDRVGAPYDDRRPTPARTLDMIKSVDALVGSVGSLIAGISALIAFATG